MNKINKNNSGVTLVALVITIIMMMIIASIAIYEGKEIIAKSKAQTIETNMLTIQAKAKAYAEEIDAKVWALGDDKENKRNDYFTEKGFEKLNENEYKVKKTGLEKMGLSDINDENYVVIYSNDYQSIDIKYLTGIKYNGKMYNKLSDLQKALQEAEE